MKVDNSSHAHNIKNTNRPIALNISIGYVTLTWPFLLCYAGNFLLY